MHSVVNKVSELYDILYNFAPDCLLVSESWLHGDIWDGILDPKSAYNIFRKVRVGCRGVAFVHLLKCSALPVFLHDKYTNLELIHFINVRSTLRMFIVYGPPYFDGNTLTVACMYVTT